MANWKDRLLGEANKITLTSPSGIAYTPYWPGKTSVSGEKKIGEFSYPGFNGTEIQDLQSKARKYPLTLWFVGDNNDIEANNFIDSLNDEIGPWQIDNPAWGIFNAQLISFTGQIDVLDNGNISTVNTQWMRSTTTFSQISEIETLENIENQIENINTISATQYFDSIIEGVGVLAKKAASLEQSLKKSVSDSVTQINSVLATTAQLDAEISNRFTSITQSISQTLESATFQALVLAGQIQLLIQLPAVVEGITTTGKVNKYISLIDSFIEAVPTTSTDEDINKALTIELTTTAAISALCLSAVTGEYKTRKKALNNAGVLLNTFSKITNALESIQDLYNNNPVYIQYKAQSKTYSEIRQLVSFSIRYLLDISENLKTEKIIKVVDKRTPISLAAEYYNSIDEESIDLILDANELKGFERILLNIGREIIIYI